MKLAMLAATLVAATTLYATTAGAVLAPVDFSTCMNTSADYGQPVGASTGDTGTPLSRLTFNLADPSAGNNFWRGETAGNKLTINLSVKSPPAVYTMMNTWWGQKGVVNAVVSLVFASGRRKTFKLVGDEGVRDYVDGSSYTSNLNGTTSQAWWDTGSNNLDVQRLKLGSAFIGDTLKRIVVSAPAGSDPGAMQPILFAIGIAGIKSVSSKCIAQ